MASDPLTTFEGIEPGSVLIVSKLLTDKKTGDEYWWKTFRVVTEWHNARSIQTMILRMTLDLDKDDRALMVGTPDEVVVLLSPDELPQGVRAMMMKHIMRGAIEIKPK